MSRVRKAALTAGFAYGQFAVAIVSGIVLVPITLAYLGARTWGVWLATGELLAYAGMIDLGVMGVLPWMLAEVDGRDDRAAMRRLVAHGVLVGVVVAAAYATLAAGLWTVLPSLLRLHPEDRELVTGPLALVVAATAVGYPLRAFRAVLAGLQDVTFNGIVSLAQAGLTIGLTVVLLMNGYGVYALAAGGAAPALGALVAALARAYRLAPDLFSGWSPPTIPELRTLVANGVGVWLAMVGWQLLAATNAVVITFLGHPEWVPIYACTAKLGAMSAQIAWVLPDSGLVGLAQLHGERRNDARLRAVVVMMLRLHLLLAGAAACMLLAANPAFVGWWVGSQYFGGVPLNALLAAGIVASSISHGLATTASVLGNRFLVGVVTLVNGALQIALAVGLGGSWGLPGVAAAALVAGAATSMPAGLWLLRTAAALSARTLWRELATPWLARAAPFAAAAAGIGMFDQSLGLLPGIGLAALVSLGYVWRMRPLYAQLPLDEKWTRWLVRVKLMSPPPVAAVAGEPL